MRKTTLLTALTALISFFSFAQPASIGKISEATSMERMKTNLYWLAGDELKGRLMGSHEDTVTAQFVADWFKKCQLAAPYKNGTDYLQSITVLKLTHDDFISVSGKNYKLFDGWYTNPSQVDSLKANNIPVVFSDYDFGDTSYNNFKNAELSGKAIVILLHGSNTAFNTNSRIALSKILKEKGALVAFVYMPKAGDQMIKNLSAGSFHSFYKNVGSNNSNAPLIPVAVLGEEICSLLLSQSGLTINDFNDSVLKTNPSHCISSKSSLSIQFTQSWSEEHAPNVIGIIRGTNDAAGWVLISAHHDHDGKNGNIIYPGAVDNASGTVALMELAALMQKAIQNDYRPKRTIVFASFTGEERGLLGSYYFAEHPVYPIINAYAVLNLDMVGRVDSFYSGKRADSNYAYILVKDSLNRGLRNSLYTANESYVQLKLDTYYEEPDHVLRRLQGSDQYPFFLKGIPFVRIDCGFCKDYHQPTDTPDKINYDLLYKQTRLAFLTLWNIANN